MKKMILNTAHNPTAVFYTTYMALDQNILKLIYRLLQNKLNTVSVVVVACHLFWQVPNTRLHLANKHFSLPPLSFGMGFQLKLEIFTDHELKHFRQSSKHSLLI